MKKSAECVPRITVRESQSSTSGLSNARPPPPRLLLWLWRPVDGPASSIVLCRFRPVWWRCLGRSPCCRPPDAAARRFGRACDDRCCWWPAAARPEEAGLGAPGRCVRTSSPRSHTVSTCAGRLSSRSLSASSRTTPRVRCSGASQPAIGHDLPAPCDTQRPT